MNKAFVMGGTGFVGERVCAQLLAQGWQVTVPTRSRASSGTAPRIGGVTLLELDVHDEAALRGARVESRGKEEVERLKTTQKDRGAQIFFVSVVIAVNFGVSRCPMKKPRALAHSERFLCACARYTASERASERARERAKRRT